MKATFTSQHIIQKLVSHYGLPAFLFKARGDGAIEVATGKTSRKVLLIDYAQYTGLAQLSLAEKPLLVFEDQWHTRPDVVASKISRLAAYHDTLSGRNCGMPRIQKKDAEDFLDRCHLMGYATSAFHYGLVYQKQLVGVATYGKGRKMDRLPGDKRSFEMIRYACLPGVTVIGGLSKLINAFIAEHKPGDIMTYIDKLAGETTAFEKNGFKVMADTPPLMLYVNTYTHARYYTAPESMEHVIAFETLGNSKLVKTL